MTSTMSTPSTSVCFISSPSPAGTALEPNDAVDSRGTLPHGPPPSFLMPRCHPLEPQVTEEINGYFIEHWPFANEKAIRKFRDAGFSRVTCCYYPEALDDRIGFACRLLTLLFLIDGLQLPSPRYAITDDTPRSPGRNVI